MEGIQLTFGHQWRPYQRRVLDAIDEHLDDRRLHIVAAPGAGKTTLGIEVFRKLGKKALVLSPTRIIRDQWIERLNDFVDCPDPFALAWVSNDLAAPEAFTSVTYQSLHAKVKSATDEEELEPGAPNAAELEQFIAHLEQNNIEVLILDEAHHLRAQWYKALDTVCQKMPDLVLVALTATPPYDVQGSEWRKYEQLCGPIDEEISIPELVKASTLAPHQDFVWAVDASSKEKLKIAEFDGQVRQLCASLADSEMFEEICLSHPWLDDAETMTQEIVKDPAQIIAILSFMQFKQLALPGQVMLLLDLAPEHIPELDRRWWQTLLETVLFSKAFAHEGEHKVWCDDLKKRLRAAELLHQRELRIASSKMLERSLSLSPAKIEGCAAIHRAELKARGQSLRQVVLTDYIRDEALSGEGAIGEVTFGAWPVFAKLIDVSKVAESIGLLTGRICVVHQSLLPCLLRLDSDAKLSTSELAECPGYLKISGPLNLMTSVFTQLLCEGKLKTLIGTRALLGEGWDAPVVNSLILASAVGSFMLTNQMRGRAIRIDKTNPQKVGSIWHLVAIDRDSWSGLVDHDNLQRRFGTFVGLAENKPVIETGYQRLSTLLEAGLAREESRRFAPFANNKQMLRRLKKVDKLAERWQSALNTDENSRVLPSVETSRLEALRSFHLTATFKKILKELAYGLGSVVSFVLEYGEFDDPTFILTLFGLAMTWFFIKHLPQTIKATRIMLKHLPVDGSLQQIGLSLAQTLCETGKITTELNKLEVETCEAHDGTAYVSLTGGSFYESSLFADCMAEILAPIDNPRYLVVREGQAFGASRKDYHAVPACIAAKKALAEVFSNAWNENVGSAELIYTRNADGRETLLKARVRAFSSTFAKDIKRQDRWC